MLRRIFALLRQRSRRKRYLCIQDTMRVESASGWILDLGGGPASFFAAMFPKPGQVILLEVGYDLARQAKIKQPGLHAVVADGMRLPFADFSVEMTICNSVIEHVDDPNGLAREISRVSRSYFLQTPHSGFPLEPHSFIAIPFYSHIPWVWLRRFVCRVFGANFEYVNSVRYLSEQRLRQLFPQAIMAYEKAFGLRKSFYVYRPNKSER